MRLLTAKEEERKRIARELHDDFSQRLALVAVEVDLLNEQAKADEESKMEQLESISFNLRELSTDVGRIANQLHPAQLERLGLVAAMQAFCEDTEQRWSVSVHFEQQGKISKELGFPEALCLYRVLQEGLQNAVKHSESREVKVELKGEEEQIRLAVSDRGKGFDAHDEAIRNGLGLVSMRERVKQVFGSFEIDSKLGQGTTIVVTVPLVPKASDGRAAYTRQAARALPLIDSGESPPRKS